MIQPGDIVSNPIAFQISVNNKGLNAGLRRLIQRVEYESSDGMADMAKINLIDPLDDQGNLPVRDSLTFAVGNTLGIFGGYGTNIKHIGHVIIRKVRWTYPQDGQPTVEVTGYSRVSEMADNSPLPLSELEKAEQAAQAKSPGKTKRGKPKKPKVKFKSGRRFADSKYSDAVRARADMYGFDCDIDDTPDAPHDFVQKVGLSDYDFVQGIANITGFMFWVDSDQNGKWKLHFKDPDKVKPGDLGQDKEYTFKWNEGDFSTILTFEPEIAIQGASTKFKVECKDWITGQVIEADLEEADPSADVMSPPGGESFDISNPPQLRPIDTDIISGDLVSGSAIKLFVGDYSFQIQANRRFKDADEIARWARQWWRRSRDNFIQAHVQLVGVETLRARQTHRLGGIGRVLSGQYYFTRVRHVFDTNGYQLDCNVRRIVTTPAPMASLAFTQPAGSF